MIDTIRVRIPLTKKQHTLITKSTLGTGELQRALYSPTTGEVHCTRLKGLAELDQHSYHRHIYFDFPELYTPDYTYLVFEFSIPKFWYGHNISLLYDFLTALQEFKRLIEKQFGLHTKRKSDRLPDVLSWLVSRVDICYAWQFPSQSICHQYLDSLKRLRYPRLKPIPYPTSLMFLGTTYSLKFYEKLPEFIQHDAKELKKNKANPDYIDYLKKKADGVLRVEATLRHRYLTRIGIETVADLVNPIIEFVLPSEEWADHPDKNYQAAGVLIAMNELSKDGLGLASRPNNLKVTEPASDRYSVLTDNTDNIIGCISFEDLAKYAPESSEPTFQPIFEGYWSLEDEMAGIAPPPTIDTRSPDDLVIQNNSSLIKKTPNQDLQQCDLTGNTDNVDEMLEDRDDPDEGEYDSFIYHCTGKSFYLTKKDALVERLNFFIKRFIGEHTGMQDVDQIQIKLNAAYKSVKVGRLTAFWLYVQKFGASNARDVFGRDSFDYNRRELKKAGVNLIEPPSNVIRADKEFLARFRLDIPSTDAVNRVDDFREGDNLLNFRPQGQPSVG